MAVTRVHRFPRLLSYPNTALLGVAWRNVVMKP